MRLTDFDIYRDLLKEKSGLIITQDKIYLLESRLGPVAKKWGYPGLEALTLALQGAPKPELVNDVVEAMTTNETSFFRDTRPFDQFKAVILPKIMEKRAATKKIRIWCAAASSGQEPYSLVMILEEMKAKLPGWKVEILATDISNDILAQARQGVYTQFEVQRGLPIQMLMTHFVQDGDKWQISDAVKKQVTFQKFNLLDNMSALGRFDIIFCRNVLIYFDEPTKRGVLERMAKQCENDGFLLLGGAETVLGITEEWRLLPEQRGLYVRKDSPHLTTAPAVSKTASA
ncbi:MAG: protein-glutamate O-methyltransferase CheR [Alphaproteobacteria bacterium]|nr:protein-glutamate O-methyltransferase CheR [Alphaproteobacteria bacterium]